MKQLRELQKKYSNEEIAESYIFPDDSDIEQKNKAKEQFVAFRNKRSLQQPKEERIITELLRLKFIMEDYIRDSHYDKQMQFGYFLRAYIHKLDLKQKEFAEDIGIKPVELSHYLSGRRKPGEEVIIRLEIHSNKNIPAIYWYKILEKENEYEIANNIELRSRERRKVKNQLTFAL